MSGNGTSDLVFSARNNHPANLGTPPRPTNADDSVYVGCFENSYGEQWVFTYDRKSRRAELRGGDLKWGRRVEVRNHDGLPDIGDLILNKSEGLWLHACWLATVGRAKRERRRPQRASPAFSQSLNRRLPAAA